MTDRHGCSERIYSGYEMHYCSRRGVIEDGGKWYCKQHSPEAVAKRRQESRDRFRDKWDAIELQEKARVSRETAIANAKKALQKIVGGSILPPSTIACEALKELEDAGV